MAVEPYGVLNWTVSVDSGFTESGQTHFLDACFIAYRKTKAPCYGQLQ
jgi:hypothetical protein